MQYYLTHLDGWYIEDFPLPKAIRMSVAVSATVRSFATGDRYYLGKTRPMMKVEERRGRVWCIKAAGLPPVYHQLSQSNHHPCNSTLNSGHTPKMALCWISFAAVLTAFLSSAAGQTSVQDEYIRNIVSSLLSVYLQQSLQTLSILDTL